MRKLIEKAPWLHVYVKVKLHLRTNAPQQSSLWCYMGGQAPHTCHLCRRVCTAIYLPCNTSPGLTSARPCDYFKFHFRGAHPLSTIPRHVYVHTQRAQTPTYYPLSDRTWSPLDFKGTLAVVLLGLRQERCFGTWTADGQVTEEQIKPPAFEQGPRWWANLLGMSVENTSASDSSLLSQGRLQTCQCFKWRHLSTQNKGNWS